MNIFHLPDNVGNNVSNLVAAEKLLGLNSKKLILEKNSSFYCDVKSDVLLTSSKSLNRLLYTVYFMTQQSSIDIMHFNFGASLLHFPTLNINLLDLPLYSKNTKKIMTYQGCDARQKFPTVEKVNAFGGYAACTEANCYGGICNTGLRDKQRAKAIEKADKYCDYMFATNPDLLNFLPSSKSLLLPYLTSPNLLNKNTNYGGDLGEGPLRLSHAPTERAAKGTAKIVEAVDKLKSKYPGRIDLDLIENSNNTEAMSRISKSHLFLDQIRVGWYGVAAVEAMSMGVPVMVYINHLYDHYVPARMLADMPFIEANPQNIFNALENVIVNREILTLKSKQSMNFVKKWHNPLNVARLTKLAYEGKPVNEIKAYMNEKFV